MSCTKGCAGPPVTLLYGVCLLGFPAKFVFNHLILHVSSFGCKTRKIDAWAGVLGCILVATVFGIVGCISEGFSVV